jgi:hypothetical protein
VHDRTRRRQGHDREPPGNKRDVLRSPLAVLLVALMAIGSIAMWIGVPAGLIYAASQVADSPNPSVGPYLLIAAGLPLGMALCGWLLGRLNRAHARVTGIEDDKPQQATWLRSMRGERGSTRRTGCSSASWSSPSRSPSWRWPSGSSASRARRCRGAAERPAGAPGRRPAAGAESLRCT